MRRTLKLVEFYWQRKENACKGIEELLVEPAWLLAWGGVAAALGGEDVTAGGRGSSRGGWDAFFLSLKSPTDLSNMMLTVVLFRLLFCVASPDHYFSDAKSGVILENKGDKIYLFRKRRALFTHEGGGSQEPGMDNKWRPKIIIFGWVSTELK